MGASFKRQELYDLVWSKPMRDLAVDAGVSDVALAKACRKANIPVPPRGYWIKRDTRASSSRIALPPRFPGASNDIEFGKPHSHWRPYSDKDILEATVPPIPTFEEDIASVRERVRKMVGKVPAVRNFDNAFGDVAKLLSHDDERRASKWSFDKPKYESGIERRRLLIIHSLCLALRSIGCTSSTRTSKYYVDVLEERGIYARIGEQSVVFTLELITKTTNRPSKSDNDLRLGLGSAHSRTPPKQFWDDTTEASIESRLSEIVVELVVLAEVQCREAAVSNREWLIKQKARVAEESRRRKEEEERKAREQKEKIDKAKIDSLLDQASDLQKAQTIRSYVQMMRERSNELPVDASKFASWANWALIQADRIDPTKSGRFLATMAIDFVADNANDEDDDHELD